MPSASEGNGVAEILSKTCRACRTEKPVEAFHLQSDGAQGRSGRCRLCYNTLRRVLYQARRAGVIDMAPVISRVCLDCGVDKPAAAFPVAMSFASGIGPRCRPCVSARGRLQRYDLTHGAYEELMLAQAGLCAICQRPEVLFVDHHHGTGAVRGLLCSNCNCGIGLLGDDADRLVAAAFYVLETAGVAA